jgi:hypothetical protein
VTKLNAVFKPAAAQVAERWSPLHWSINSWDRLVAHVNRYSETVISTLGMKPEYNGKNAAQQKRG